MFLTIQLQQTNYLGMKVGGFTFVKNAIINDYPVVESILSILPLCDDLVVAVGKSDDDTEELIRSINNPKIRILPTVWNMALKGGGRVLADETNKAFREVPTTYDWAFYIQADEIIHEQFHPIIRQGMQLYKDKADVDGLLLKYKHFYGSYDYIGSSIRWYRNEIRIVRPSAAIYSYRDAQGFRKNINEKLRVKPIDAYVFHYGWVKDPYAMENKQLTFSQLWDKDSKDNPKEILKSSGFDYSQIDALERYTGTHPKVMQQRIANRNWVFDHDLSHNRFSMKERFIRFVEKITGFRIGEYKNYRKI